MGLPQCQARARHMTSRTTCTLVAPRLPVSFISIRRRTARLEALPWLILTSWSILTFNIYTTMAEAHSSRWKVAPKED